MGSEITLEKLQVLIEAYTKPYTEELKKVKEQTSAATRHVEQQTSKIKNAFSKIGRVVGAALGVTAIVAFGKSCMQLGSDLQEVQNVVDVSFGKMSEQVDAFAKDAIEQFGLSELSAKKYMGTYGAMAKAFQFSTEQAYEMSAAITGLTGDVASFYNLSTDEAYTKLKSIFTGETETLKDLGVVMTQTALDQYALNNGLGKTTVQMTEQEKVMLRYQFVMSQLSNASGDFARTSSSWANQTRVLSLRFEQLKATVGQGLINAITPVLRVINAVIERLQVLAEYFRSFTTALFGDAGGGTGGSSPDSLAGLGGVKEEFSQAAASAGDINSSMKGVAKSAKEIHKALAGFDELNVLTKQADTAAADALPSVLPDVALGGLDAGLGPMGLEMPDFGTLDTEKLVDTSGVERAVEKVKELLEPLRNISFEPLVAAFGRLKEAVAPIGRTLFEGLEWAYLNLLVPLAGWTIEDLLPAFLDVLSGALNVLSAVIEALKPLATWLWDTFLEPLAKWTGGVIVSALELLADALNGISEWIRNNQEVVQVMTGVVLAFFAAWKAAELAEFIINAGGVIGILSTLKNAIVGATVAKIADKVETLQIIALYAKDFVVSIANSAAALVKSVAQWGLSTAAKIADTAATIASTAATTAATAATWLFNAALAVLTSPITLVVAAIGALIAVIALLVKNWDTVSATAKKVWDAVVRVTSQAVESMREKISACLAAVQGAFEKYSFLKPIKEVWDAVRQVLSGVITFIKGTFTGNWKMAWQGIVSIFKGIMSGLVAVLKAPLNGVISLVNLVISGLNRISIDIPNWVPGFGGRRFGINIPKIPQFAEGGFPAAGQLFLANEAGPELVGTLGGRSAVANTKQIEAGIEEAAYRGMRRALLEFGRDRSDGTVLCVEGDPHGMFRIIQKEAKEYFDRTGKPAFSV